MLFYKIGASFCVSGDGVATDFDLKQALRRLGEREGGLQVVAHKVGCTHKTLVRIVNRELGVMGNPSRIGPELRKRLDAKFPGWTNVGEKNKH